MASMKTNKKTGFRGIVILILFMLVSLISINGAVLYDDINDENLISQLDQVNYKEVSRFLYLTFTNLTFDVTDGKNYASDSGLLYFVSNNNDIPIPFVTQAFYKDENNDLQATYTEVEIPASSTTTFFVEPSYDKEYIAVYMRCLGEEVNSTGFNSSLCGAGYQVREYLYIESDKGVDSVFTPLINGVVDLIVINISIWRIGYYLLIMSLVLGAIGGLVLIGKKYYDWSSTHNLFKHKNSRK